MHRKVLFNNFHVDIYGTINYNLKNKTLAKNRSTADQKRYAKSTMLIARDLHPRMKLRGRRARTREEEKKAFSLFSYCISLTRPSRSHAHLFPLCHAGYCVIETGRQSTQQFYASLITSRGRLLDSVMLPI